VTQWTFAEVYGAVAAAVPDRPAVVQGDRTLTWGQLDARAAALAADLLDAGLGRQAKVAAWLHNGPEYVETYVAAFKGGLVPVNCNYRYGAAEMTYLLDNADAEAVVLHGTFVPLAAEIRRALPRVRRWYVVDDGTTPVPPWAIDYEIAVTTGRRLLPGEVANRPDDLLLLYTGGTTGMPKGVMWPQDDLFRILGAGGQALLGVPPATGPAELLARVEAGAPAEAMVIGCPLMHGTGQFSALQALNMAGTVVLLPERRFDAEAVWRAAADHQASILIIVGQTFGRPMIDVLRAAPHRFDLSSVRVITSSGVMWSQENKDEFLELLPDVLLLDNYGSSEAVGVGASVSRKGRATSTGSFRLGRNSAVFTEDGRRVEPGSGERGLLAVSGPLPIGYYKDEAKTAATFREFEGRRWSVPGDWAEVTEEGRVRLLGRGSSCINTGGEKVFPEEIEEVLKTHAAVRDAVVVGVPDDRLGEAVCAVVETPGDDTPVDADELAGVVRATLAGYKVPRHVVFVDTIGRAANGKADPTRLKALAIERLQTRSAT
jgi:acyl-CoA synthetase (AMP-forming)/AMP-acid ligase II